MKRATLILLWATTAIWCRGEPAAVVLKYSGEVNYKLAGSNAWTRLVQTNLALAVGAEIGTATNAEAILKLGGTQLITVRELTWLRINRAGADDSQVSCGGGKLAVHVPKKTEKTSCEIVTPAAIAAVRGTFFTVESDAQKTTQITVDDGRVDVTGQVANSRTVTVGKGQTVQVVFNQPPEDPRPAEMKRLEEMKGFRENLAGVAMLGGGVGAAATQIAEENMKQLQDAGKQIEQISQQHRGAEKSRVDMPALKQAFIRCVADTGYTPAKDDRKFDEQTSQLELMLVEGKKPDGTAIPGWKGPYVEGNLKDPFGRFYKVRYIENAKGEGRYEIFSLGQDPVKADDDPIPQMLRLDRLTGPDGKPPAKPTR